MLDSQLRGVDPPRLGEACATQDRIAALQRGAEVRIVMTYAQPSSSGKPSTSMANLTTLAGQGAKVTLYAPQSVVPEALYIHAKSITVNGADVGMAPVDVSRPRCSVGSSSTRRPREVWTLSSSAFDRAWIA